MQIYRSASGGPGTSLGTLVPQALWAPCLSGIFVGEGDTWQPYPPDGA